MALEGAIGSIDLWRSNFAADHQIPRIIEILPGWSLSTWLIIFLATTLVLLLEGSYRAIARRDAAIIQEEDRAAIFRFRNRGRDLITRIHHAERERNHEREGESIAVLLGDANKWVDETHEGLQKLKPGWATRFAEDTWSFPDNNAMLLAARIAERMDRLDQIVPPPNPGWAWPR